MTEQPVETEQQFLGNAPRVVQAVGTADVAAADHGALPPAPLQHYAPNAHRGRFSPLRDKARQDIQEAIAERAALNATDSGPTAADRNFQDKVEGRRMPLDLRAEIHAGNAVQSLQNGELDEGIAWLQSALAFAQNFRHSPKEATV